MDYTFDIDHANKYGVNEAIILKNLIFWIRTNKANGRNFFEGRTWCYNKIQAWKKYYPFWEEIKVWRILNSLYKQGVILKQCFGGGHDRTTYYALADESMLQMPDDISKEQDKPDAPKDDGHKKESTKKEKTATAQRIHEHYKIKVKDGRTELAIENIKKLLDDYTAQQLIECANNYAKKKNNTDKKFKLEPQNFFKSDFKDYLPKPKQALGPPDPNCKLCNGDGEWFAQATSKTVVCTCRYLNKKINQ